MDSVSQPEVGGVPPPAPVRTLKNLPPSGPWLPDNLGAAFPELAGHRYRDAVDSLIQIDGGWSVVGATRRGAYHAHRGTFREDSYSIASSRDCTVVCVADGVGSSALSRVASEWLSQTAARNAEQALAGLATFVGDITGAEVRDRLGRAIREAGEGLLGRVLNAGQEIKEFRCTLLVAALVWRPAGPWLAAAQIGDGALLALDCDGSVSRLLEADSGDVACEITAYMPDHPVHGPYVFTPRDIIEPGSLITRLLLHSDPVTEFLWSLLSLEARNQLGELSGNGPDTNAAAEWLASELNQAIDGPRLFADDRFGGVALSAETARLLAANPKGEELRRLHRLLLADAFPNELAHQSIKTVWLDASTLAAMVVGTDGVDDGFFAKSRLIFQQLYGGVDEPHASFKSQPIQKPILSDAAPNAALQTWLGFDKRGEFDDRTIVVLHRSPAELSTGAWERLK